MKFQNYPKFFILSLLFILFITLPLLQAQTASAITILIDPGHGGKDPGVVWNDSLTEKQISMQYARALAMELEKHHFIPSFTHQSVDSFLLLQKRLEMISASGAKVFISLHVNSTSKDSNAIELFYNPHDSSGLTLGRFLEKQLENQGQNVLLSPARFYLIKFSPVPAVMVSLRAGKSVKSGQQLLDVRFKKQICRALAKGIKNFLKIKKNLNSETEYEK